MIEQLISLDKKFFLAINGTHDSFLDFILYWASNRLIWIPFYIWLLYVIYKNYAKKSIYILLAVILIITSTDQICNLIKNSVMRLRPCHEPSLQAMIHLVNDYCGGQFGFISSHAANSMGLATFIILILPKGYKDVRMELISYVLLIGYSRIYLAAHYPLDVLGGWLLGMIIGFLAAYIIKTRVPYSSNKGELDRSKLNQ